MVINMHAKLWWLKVLKKKHVFFEQVLGEALLLLHQSSVSEVC